MSEPGSRAPRATRTETGASDARSRIRLRLARRGFELDVEADWDERVAVVFGPSGSGKSTLFHVLLGFEPRARAFVRLAGTALDDPDAGLHLPPERRGLGWVPQDPTLFPHLSVERNVRFGAARGGSPDALARAIDVLEIGDLLERRADELSGGERQRVAIARALAAAPRALLLDEPLAALDLPLRARVLPFLLRVRDELDLPILYITHDPDEALVVGERVLVLDRGRLVASGPPRDVLWSRAVLPLSEALGLENVVDGRVVEASSEGALVRSARGLRLVVPVPLAPGTAVRLGLRAQDVLVALGPPGPLSARNVLPAVVTACEVYERDALVHLEASGETLRAKLTRAAAEKLDLRPGAAVYAVIKAQAIRRVG